MLRIVSGVDEREAIVVINPNVAISSLSDYFRANLRLSEMNSLDSAIKSKLRVPLA